MAKINFHTDRQGGIKGNCHVEFEWDDGRIVMVTLADDRLHIIGGPLDVHVKSMNALDVYQSGKAPDIPYVIKSGLHHPHMKEIDNLRKDKEKLEAELIEVTRQLEEYSPFRRKELKDE